MITQNTTSDAEHRVDVMRHDTDIVAARREYAYGAIDGAINQFSAACRFLALGDDRYAAAAFKRGIEFARMASPEIRALVPKAEDQPLADGSAA